MASFGTDLPSPPPAIGADAIRAVGLTRRYGSGEAAIPALRAVDLAVPRGQFLAIVGPSGSGKSTLLHLLGGVDAADAGNLWLDGVDLSGLSERERTIVRRRKIGFIFQAFHLVPSLDTLANVALPLRLDRVARRDALVRARQCLELVGMTARAGHYPRQLSGGEQQRVAIARALVAQPSLVLADEPTGNLDSSNSGQVISLLRKLVERERKTMVVVTHDEGVARAADRIVRLLDGRVCYDGRPAFDGTTARMNEEGQDP